MKTFIRFTAMAALCAVTAISFIAVATADPQATTSNIIWALVGSASFVAAAMVNPMRGKEERYNRSL